LSGQDTTLPEFVLGLVCPELGLTMLTEDAGAMAKSKDCGPRMPGLLTNEDMALWRTVTRNDQTLPGRDHLEKTDRQPSEIMFQQKEDEKAEEPERLRVNFSATKSGPEGEGLDKRTATRLRRGQILIDSSLDLHGLTQAEAYAMLVNTLTAAQGRGERCVLVITGKGLRREGGGILKTMLPRWLAEPAIRPLILGKEMARPQHGGTGAMYVLLRKLR
jgi:DNA-nicking Smr family endonuclease